MSEKNIRSIICAVYGKPSSRATVTRAINLALEHNAKLTFVHAINAEFLKSSGPSMMPLKTVYKQLHDMGNFAMLMLIDRAERRGVSQAAYLVREGDVQAQLHKAVLELRPDLLVIGEPTTALGEAAFKSQSLKEFIQQLQDALHIQVEIVEPE
ncbi:MAG: universal stress protein [Chloroflexi bacterium]|jgi:nucleotide-binding universal stress UspA family protein|nr:universal stress protein [Chloroflexota bacterium]